MCTDAWFWISYLSNILLKHTQLQTLVEAELTVLPRPLNLVLTLHKRKKENLSHCIICPPTLNGTLVRRTCMTW